MPACTKGTIEITTIVAGNGSSSTHWLTSTIRKSVPPTPGASANTTDASTSPTNTYAADHHRCPRASTQRKPSVASSAKAAPSGRTATGSPPPTTPSTRVSSAPPVSRVRARSTGTLCGARAPRTTGC